MEGLTSVPTTFLVSILKTLLSSTLKTLLVSITFLVSLLITFWVSITRPEQIVVERGRMEGRALRRDIVEVENAYLVEGLGLRVWGLEFRV